MSTPKPARGVAIASAVAVAAILVFERVRPLRSRTRRTPPRVARNAAMGLACAAVIQTVERPLTRAIAARNSAMGRGLAHRAPRPVRAIVAFLAMDYGFYVWHVLTHRVPLLWRLHRVHHVDADMDASTALRFHFIDMLVSLPWRALQVRASGIDASTLNAWERFFALSILFHHSNLRFPAGWDRVLANLLTTPEMHGIHHSARLEEQHRNWSSGLSMWDRLHGTLDQVPQPPLRIGVDDPSAESDIALIPALRSPFRGTR